MKNRPRHFEGLSPEEAAEFEALAKATPLAGEIESRLRDARWIELYLKRETARLQAARCPLH